MTATLVVAGYTRQVFLHWLTGWSWGLTLLANQAVAPLIGLAIWTQATGGRSDVATYYVAMLVVGRFVAGYSAHTFSGTIYNGELTDALLRPQPVVLSQLGWYLGISAFDLIFLPPLLIAVALLAPVHIDATDLALTVPALVLAAVASFCFDFALACSAFWTQRYFATTAAGGRLVFLFGGVAAPIPLLPDGLRDVFSVLPFRWMRGYPAEVAAGLVPSGELFSNLATQAAWVGVLAGLATVVYRAGVRRYIAVGG